MEDYSDFLKWQEDDDIGIGELADMIEEQGGDR